MFKKFIAAVFLAISFTGVQAATIDTVTAVPGLPTFTVAGQFASTGTGEFGFSGSGMQGPFPFTVNASQAGISAVLFAPPTPLGLAGTLEDVQADAGSLTALYSAPSNFFGQNFDLFLVSVLFGGNINPLTTGIQTAVSANATFTAVTEVAPIPLPAGILLLLSGMGGLMVMRRRRA